MQSSVMALKNAHILPKHVNQHLENLRASVHVKTFTAYCASSKTNKQQKGKFDLI